MAERTCLLNKRTSKGYPGFESLSLRNKAQPKGWAFFVLRDMMRTRTSRNAVEPIKSLYFWFWSTRRCVYCSVPNGKWTYFKENGDTLYSEFWDNEIITERADFFKNSFKTPILINIYFSVHYIHNEVYETLEEVIWERFLFLKLDDLLTKNNKRLCALLRLNLSSKEIAAIQNISLVCLKKRH